MAGIDYEYQYNNRARIPEYREIIARWQSASAIERAAARAALDQPYGDADRQRYDLYGAEADGAAPLILYIHGGYWQMGSRQDTAFIARAFTAAAIDIAVASYSLCPQATVVEIIDELRRCAVALWARTGKRPIAVGHSAGGHLAAALVATDWHRWPGAPPDLVRAGCAISGVFDLAPMIATTMNRALQLDERSAADASPLAWAPPPPGRVMVTAVGGDETAEFHRQSRALLERWSAAGVATESLSIAGANHFTIVDHLTQPASALFRRVARLAHETAAS